MVKTDIRQENSFTWQTAPAESMGFDSNKLLAWQEELARRETKAFLVVRNDRIVWEWYSPDHGMQIPHGTASMAKGLIGGMSLAVAMNDGLMDLDDPAWKYIPAWKDDPLKSQITIRHLATHSSGVDNPNLPGIEKKDLPGWRRTFWFHDSPPDPFTGSVYESPVMFTPGTDHLYSNCGMAAAAYAVTASLKGTPHTDLRSLLMHRIMQPIGISDDEWSCGYNTTFNVDGLPLVANWGGAAFTARATARIGRLLMRQGDWEGKQIISSKVVRALLTANKTFTAQFGEATAFGGCFYVNNDKVWPGYPPDTFYSAGANNQAVIVAPSLNLIVVRNGRKLGDGLKDHSPLVGVLAALT